MRVLAVTGLRAEARIAAQAGLVPVCAGGAPERTATALEAALSERADGIVSFGIAGGLAPDLPPGTLVLADAVLGEDGARWATTPEWRSALRRLPAAGEGDVFGATTALATTAAKAAVHRRTGAVATDLESAVAARLAGRARLPFLVLRAIADPAERDLPQAALLPLSPDGTPDLPRILASVLGDLRQVPALLRLARDARSALRALADAAPVLGAAVPPSGRQ